MPNGKSFSHNLAHGADKIGHLLEAVSGAFCVACLAAMTIIVLLGVFFRYVVNSPFMWTEEAARYLQVWMGFTAISIAIRRDKHIKVDALASFAPVWLVKSAGLFVYAVMAFFLVILLKQGYLMTVNTLAHASTIPISMVWILAALPAAALLSLAQLAVNLIKHIFGSPLTGNETTVAAD